MVCLSELPLKESNSQSQFLSAQKELLRLVNLNFYFRLKKTSNEISLKKMCDVLIIIKSSKKLKYFKLFWPTKKKKSGHDLMVALICSKLVLICIEV